MIKESELILNRDGSLYHLQLLPGHVTENVIIVGDPARVDSIAAYLDTISFRISNREFTSLGGTYKEHPILVISSGIGCDNIDIVLNELDAAININLKDRQANAKKKQLKIVRIGTCEALQDDIEPDSFLVSNYAIGLDGLLNFYRDLPSINNHELSQEFIKQTNWHNNLPYPYAVKGDEELQLKIGFDMIQGITATCPGFYGPQGRKIRLSPWVEDFNLKLSNFRFKGERIINFEMETSAIYGLGRLLGHQTCTVCTVIANRVTKQISKNVPQAVNELILTVLERLTK